MDGMAQTQTAGRRFAPTPASAENLLDAQHAVTRLLTGSEPPHLWLPRVLELICGALGWRFGSLWQRSVDGRSLRCAGVWDDPDGGSARFAEVTRGLELRPGIGLPGRVWSSRAPEWIPDFPSDPLPPRDEEAERAGLHAAFAFPITLGGEMKGVMEFFSGAVREPEPRMIEALTAIGAQVAQSLELHGCRARFRSVTDSVQEAIMILDARGAIVSWNVGAERMFGYHADEMIGRDLTPIIPERLRDDHTNALKRLAAGGRPRLVGKALELKAVRRGGEVFPVELTVASCGVGDEAFFSGIVRDISERKRLEAEMSFRANHDQLTGLPNRGMFREHLELALARAARLRQAVAVLFVDLDSFKDVNDRLGHSAGDEVLRAVAGRIRASIRDADLLARYGGDEFLVLLTDLEPADLAGPGGAASVAAERIAGALRTRFPVRDTHVRIGASVGIGITPAHGDPELAGVDELLAAADTAMYTAKAGSRPHAGPTITFAPAQDGRAAA